MRKYLFKFKGWLFVAIVFAIMFSLTNVSLAFIMKQIIDVTSSKDLKAFYDILIWFIVYIIVLGILEFSASTSKAFYVKKTMVFLKKDIFMKLINKDIKSFGEENSAKYISMLSNDMNIIEQDYFNNIFDIITSIFSFIVAFIFIINISFKITIGVVILSILSFIIPQVFGKCLSSKKKAYSDSLGVFTTKIKDMFSGFEVIKSFNLENKMEKEYKKYNEETENKKFKFSITNNIVNSISTVFGMSIFTVVFAIGTYLTIKGELTVGSMLACVQVTNNIANPIIMSIQYINKFKSVKEIAVKIEDIALKDDIIKEGIKKNSFDKDIVFDNVNFQYIEGKSALKDISLNIKRGKKYALVGASGGGKSTVLKLLLRYYENFIGSIKIDGVDIRDIEFKNIYKLESVIQQNVFMFDGNIKDNITLFAKYSDEDVERAIDVSGLGPLINRLSDGIYSNVGENGNLLSGGEKQRIAIARSVIKDTPIMILDEATSALDNETAYSIEKSLVNMDGVTSLVVTHKLWEDILKDYDEIIVMRNGEIVEKGSFYELLELKKYFYSLYYIQGSCNNEVVSM